MNVKGEEKKADEVEGETDEERDETDEGEEDDEDEDDVDNEVGEPTASALLFSALCLASARNSWQKLCVRLTVRVPVMIQMKSCSSFQSMLKTRWENCSDAKPRKVEIQMKAKLRVSFATARAITE